MATLSPRIKEAVRARARGCCEYCRCPEACSAQSHAVEHILPRIRGGADSLGNLALSCQGCNNHKHVKTEARDSLSDETVPLFDPRRMDWHEHFAWSDDFREIMPLTPIGRVTVRELCLYRTGLRNLRRVLYQMGEHPP